MKAKCVCGREIYCKKTGECLRCYHKRLYRERSPKQRAEKNKQQRKRYASDPEYRKRILKKTREHMKTYYVKKSLKEPNWNANRQKKWRKAHPKQYIILMAKSYLRRLEPTDIRALADSVIEEKKKVRE